MSGYTPELIEQLLPTIWDATYAYGMSPAEAPDPTMPKGPAADPSHGCTLFAHLADIKAAWANTLLPYEERVSLLCRFGLDWTDAEIAAQLHVSDRSIRRYLKRGVARLGLYLNGSEYDDDSHMGGDVATDV